MATYKIKSGDTLSQIAKKNNTTVRTLQKINNIADPNKIRAGKTLNLGIGKPGLSSARKMSPYAGQTKTEMRKMSMKKPAGSKSKALAAKPTKRPKAIAAKLGIDSARGDNKKASVSFNSKTNKFTRNTSKKTGTAGRRQRRMKRRA